MRRIFAMWILTIVACCILPHSVVAQTPSPESKKAEHKERTEKRIYKQSPRRTLIAHFPDDWKASDRRPALVIFRCRIPYQREHFRKLGMVVVKPQLAPVNSGNLPKMTLPEIRAAAKPRHQVEDAKSVIRYLRSHAEELGIDPQRIVATGTSGGGDLALQSSINRAFEDAADDRSISHRPDALVLYCPAFDGINIWFVKAEDFLPVVKETAPSFVDLLDQFVGGLDQQYLQPLDHRKDLIQKAAQLGRQRKIADREVKAFQAALEQFNERDWQLLHPVEDARKMSASRILTKEPLPPTIILFGTRDHLYQHQTAFVKKAKSLGQLFELEIYEGGGHSFMTQPAFTERSTNRVEEFLRKHKILP